MKTKVATLILFGCLGLAAQPAFETASIHTNNEADRPGRPIARVTSDSLIMRNDALVYLIQWAYDVPRVQIDGPPWLREVWFDVQAKSATPATETQMRVMLRKLLEDRFDLKLHKETRVLPGYAITLAKGGPKFQPESAPGDFELARTSPVVLVAHHARVADLGEGIADELGQPVTDATGLQGRYEIRLNLAPYITRAGDPGGNPGQLDMMGILFTGLQEELGLKLEARKSPVDILVIDHVEKMPTEN